MDPSAGASSERAPSSDDIVEQMACGHFDDLKSKTADWRSPRLTVHPNCDRPSGPSPSEASLWPASMTSVVSPTLHCRCLPSSVDMCRHMRRIARQATAVGLDICADNRETAKDSRGQAVQAKKLAPATCERCAVLKSAHDQESGMRPTDLRSLSSRSSCLVVVGMDSLSIMRATLGSMGLPMPLRSSGLVCYQEFAQSKVLAPRGLKLPVDTGARDQHFEMLLRRRIGGMQISASSSHSEHGGVL